MATEIVSLRSAENQAADGQTTEKVEEHPSARRFFRLPPIFMVSAADQMRLSSNFFKRPSIGEIKKQYTKSRKERGLASDSSAKLAHAPGKKIVGGAEVDAEDIKKRQYIEKKVIDFSSRNRFKNQTPILKGQVPKVPIKQIQEADKKETREEATEHRSLKSDRKEGPPEEMAAGEAKAKEHGTGEAKKDDLNLDCVICFNQKADVVCMPCGHSGICKPCSIKVCSKEAVCFLCKKPIEQLLQIDLTRTIGDMVIVLSSISISPPAPEN